MKQNSESLTPSRRDFIKLAGVGAGVTVLGPAVHSESVGYSAPAEAAAEAIPVRHAPYRVGKWLPSDQAVLDRWLAKQIRAVDANPKPLQPVVQEFKDLIENDPQIYMYFHQMFEQLPTRCCFRPPLRTAASARLRADAGVDQRDLDHRANFQQDRSRRLSHQRHPRLADGNVGGFAAFFNDK